MTEYQPTASATSFGASTPRAPPSYAGAWCRSGTARLLAKGETAPIDAFAPETVRVYRTLVLLRATGGVPPAPFRLVDRGRYYDVWQQQQQR